MKLQLYVLALETGLDYAWRRRVDPFQWGFSQGVDSHPAIDRHNRVILNSGKGQLLRFDRGGELLDVVQGSTQSTNDHSPALLPDDSLVHLQFATLRRYDPNFNVLWSTSVFSQSDPALSPNGDIALGGVRSTEPHGAPDLTYVNADGTVRWRKDSTWGNSAPAVFGPDGTLFQGIGAYHPDGTIKWGFPSSGVIALGKNGQHYSSLGRAVTARNAETGAVLWTTSLTLPTTSLIPGFALDSRDRIYVASPDGFLACLSASGQILFERRLAASLKGPPIVGPKCSVLLVGQDPANSAYSVFWIR